MRAEIHERYGGSPISCGGPVQDARADVMVLTTERESPTGDAGPGDRTGRRHRRVVGVTAVAGVTVAVLAGHDGTVGWQLARVAAIVLITALAVAAAASLGDRIGGRIA